MTPSDLTKAQWDQIVSIIRTEMASGGRLNGVTWKNTDGTAQTSTLAYVNRSRDLYTQKTPAIGVELNKGTITKYSTAERWYVTEFTLYVAVEAQSYTNLAGNSVPANGDDALAQAWAFISDGTGKGLSEIFRDPANRFLGGNATDSYITSVQTDTFLGKGDTPQVWAYIYVTLRVDSQLSIHN